MALLILKPKNKGAAYEKAAEAFSDLYFAVQGERLTVSFEDDGISDLVVIGAEDVNEFFASEISKGFESSLVSLGTDEYRIKSFKAGERKVLLLAGGRGRSTLYAVYDYFERFGNCHYFWDGDVIPEGAELPMEGIDVFERPRFEYRGLRYFAHRGLKRFQAEFWSFEDWKKELDFLIKRRLNFFMLRMGMDDVWQRAFPETVPYPDFFQQVTGKDASSYNDRSDFWTLRYRGILREKVLSYARDLDLDYPVDCGTMTHWYSRTPKAFLERMKPTFINQDVVQYTESDTGKVFDFTKDENLGYYMHLTDTMVKEYEKRNDLFHTIGLGERRLYEDPEKNFALKKIAYRRIAEEIKKRYPDSKLFLASWDFVGWWKGEEVQGLLEEMDPERTLVLDYTSEVADPEVSFLNWGVVGKFPWIFGLFHAYESETEIRGPYDRIQERLKVASEDPFCKGMILWPELSHSDPLILEYLARNVWSPLHLSVEEILEEFCQNRYGTQGEKMNFVWQNLLPLIQLADWGGYSHRTEEDPDFVSYCTSPYTHKDMWTRLTLFFAPGKKRMPLRPYYHRKMNKTRSMIPSITAALEALSSDSEIYANPFLIRDGIDLARTVANRFLNYLVILAIEEAGNRERIEVLEDAFLSLLSAMEELLIASGDFSLYESLREIQKTSKVNPDFEITLKRNVLNEYCSQAAVELITPVFRREAEAVFSVLKTTPFSQMIDFSEERKKIVSEFEQTPLSRLIPKKEISPEKAVENTLFALKKAFPLI